MGGIRPKEDEKERTHGRAKSFAKQARPSAGYRGLGDCSRASTEPLARAIRLCLEERGLRGRARELALSILTDGATRTVGLVERLATEARVFRS